MTTFTAQYAFAGSALKTELGGSVDAQYGVTKEKKDFSSTNSNNKSKSALATTANITFKIEAIESESMKYGAYIKLNTNTSPTASGNTNMADKLMLYTEGSLGRLEIGSFDGVHTKLRVSADTIASATGGVDGDFPLWVNFASDLSNKDKPKNANDLFYTSPHMPCEGNNKRSNKITYYTPQYAGFTFGVSYVQDSHMVGTTHNLNPNKKQGSFGHKNVIETGVRYDRELQKDLKIALSLLGELGQSNKYLDKNNNEFKRHNVEAWEFGGSLAYNGFSVAASYADLGKSGTEESNDDSDNSAINYGTKYWTVGTAFSNDQFSTSLTYMKSNRSGNIVAVLGNPVNSQKSKYEALVLGVDYKLLPGLMPYAEVAHFKVKRDGTNEDNKNLVFNKGTVVLVGTKIKF